LRKSINFSGAGDLIVPIWAYDGLRLSIDQLSDCSLKVSKFPWIGWKDALYV